MEFGRPGEEERCTLRKISQNDEINEWLSNEVNMRIIRSIPGSYGTVFCLHKSMTSQRFARKLLRNVRGESIEATDIVNEMELLLTLNGNSSNHIVEILGHGWLTPDTECYFIDMEYCQLNLDEYIHGKRTFIHGLQDYKASIRDGHLSYFTFAILQEILSGLVFIHSLGYVHCDLKPQKVLYSEKGWWRIADFGIALEHPISRNATTSGDRGTPGYRAPEMLKAELGNIKNADIWSLGCILFEICTGRRLFADDNVVRDFRSFEDFAVPFVDGMSDNFKYCINSQWLSKMLQTDPQKRPSAKKLADSLGSLFTTLVPSPAEMNTSSWISEESALGTEGLVEPSCIQWEELFFPSTFHESEKRLGRYVRISINRILLLGYDHPATRSSCIRSAWAGLYFDQHDYSEQYFRTLSQVYEKDLGLSHRGTLASKYGLALSLLGQERSEQAIQLFEEILPLQNSVLGPNHQETLATMRGLTWASYDIGRCEDILQRLKDILRERRSVLGFDDPHTIESMDDLGILCSLQNDDDSALGWLNMALVASKKALGPRHPLTVRVMTHTIKSSAFRREPDFQLIKETFEAQQAVFGTSDPIVKKMGISVRSHVGEIMDDWLRPVLEQATLVNSCLDDELFLEAALEMLISEENQSEFLQSVAGGFEERFRQSGSREDIDKAVTISQRVLASSLQDSPEYWSVAHNLGIVLALRFVRTGSMDDLNQSIAQHAEALSFIPESNWNYGVALSNLGNTLQMRFKKTGSTDDFDRSIQLMERGLESLSQDHPLRYTSLGNLCIALHNRFERTGSIEDLDRAIDMEERALISMPQDDPDRESLILNLSSALQTRFGTVGSMFDIDRAIAIQEQAIASLPQSHHYYSMHLNDFANALLARYGRTASLTDLSQSIAMMEKAILSAPLEQSGRSNYLNSLGVALRIRFEGTGSLDDLHRAIEVAEQALESTAQEDFHYASYLHNLGFALWKRFEKTGSLDDLNQSIETMNQAVVPMLEQNGRSTYFLIDLCVALRERFDRIGSVEDFDRAVIGLEQAAVSSTAHPRDRVKAAALCSFFLMGRDDQRAKFWIETAVNHLPALSPRALKPREQQWFIKQFHFITSHAVALFLDTGESAYRATQLSEAGRGIMANLLLNTRSDTSRLSEYHPHLARQFDDIRQRLDSPEITNGSPPNWSITSRNLTNQFETLLATIRQQPGFDTFLLGPSELELRALAGGDSIVILNFISTRGDALIITSSGVRSLKLPLLQISDVEKFAIHFLEAISDERLVDYRSATKKLNTVLEWLWDSIVEPILDALGFKGPPYHDRIWPRVWWVRTGAFGIFPIHAAGYHNSTPPRSAIDRVNSSYVPTVKSLAYAREIAAKADSMENQSALLVGMSKTPEMNDLPFVEREIDELQGLFLPRFDTKVMRFPTREEVLSAIPKYQIVHLSCHGFSDADPSQSSLLLEDWKTAPLTVSDLVSLHTTGKIAYLSACHTSTTHDLKLLDESISLASAILLSGFPSVIGSLWQINDAHSAEVAKDVYTSMLDGGKLKTEMSSGGLNQAVRKLRERTRSGRMNNPLLWAPYIHVGI